MLLKTSSMALALMLASASKPRKRKPWQQGLLNKRTQNLMNSYEGRKKGSANSAIIHTKLHQDVKLVRSSWCDEQHMHVLMS